MRFAEWLLARPEARIAVVSHGHFLFHLFGELGGLSAPAERRMGNSEMREMLLCDGPGAVGEAAGMAEMAVADAEWADEEAKLLAALEEDERLRLEMNKEDQERTAAKLAEHERFVDERTKRDHDEFDRVQAEEEAQDKKNKADATTEDEHAKQVMHEYVNLVVCCL